MTRFSCVLALILLSILEIAPVPILGLLGLYIVLLRPRWFLELVEKIYRD